MISVVPNALCVFRLALACCFWAIPAPWRLAAIVAAGVSDWLDGFIARRYQAMSMVGGLLDAIADKLLTLSVLLTFAVAGDILWWQVVLVLSRDLVVGALSIYALVIRRLDAFGHMPAKFAGKVTTIALFFWFVALLIPLPSPVIWALFAVAGGTSVLAGADYSLAFLRRPAELRGRRSGRAASSRQSP